MKELFSKPEYLDCHFMKHSLHFFHNSIKACCTNALGPCFYRAYKGGEVDWNHVYEIRKKFIKRINSYFNKKTIPGCCKRCSELNSYITNEKVKEFPNVVDRLYFHNNMSCNAHCVYCCYWWRKRGYNYKVLPLVKSLIDNKILSKNTYVYMSGGEITIYPEFDDLVYTLLDYIVSRIEILTSGIKYCKSIEEALRRNQCMLLISPDAGCRETYKKIKQVDCFDDVINNIKTYISHVDSAKENIILKYIIVDDINDNENEMKSFLDLAYDMGIKNVRLDIDYEKYKFNKGNQVPERYFDLIEFFNEHSAKSGLNVLHCNQVDFILNNAERKSIKTN